MSVEEITQKADFSQIRYAQCWEDADILLSGLNIQPGETCLSIASAGDNTLSLLARDPHKVIALDLSIPQIFCLELRIAAYRQLTHAQLLGFMGSTPCENRKDLYYQCRVLLKPETAHFFDQKCPELERYGFGGIGKFERYFRLFKTMILPCIHNKKNILELFKPKSLEDRTFFFETHWNTLRWKFLIRLFFSEFLMGRLGRDPAFFDYIEGNFAEHVARRIRYAMTHLDPSQNPYLQWILTGRHEAALPHALRLEHFEVIRDRLDRIEIAPLSTQEYLQSKRDSGTPLEIHKFNLSNIFEYMSLEQYYAIYADLLTVIPVGGRLAYWNMMAPRCAKKAFSEKIQLFEDICKKLYAQDKAFFYNRFVVEEVVA
jgi:S-adenosylmethionine-diacylglycerol 3-amino-3-carboxypropyl transferase